MRPMGVEKENYFLSLCLAGVSFLTLREKKILLKNLDSAAALALLSIDDIAMLDPPCGTALRVCAKRKMPKGLLKRSASKRF